MIFLISVGSPTFRKTKTGVDVIVRVDDLILLKLHENVEADLGTTHFH